MKKKPPGWKEIILSSKNWPRTLVVPQRAQVPRESKAILCSMDANEYWDWQLIRGPAGRSYYLRVWPPNDPLAYKDGTPAVKLTAPEALRFVMANWVPAELIHDAAYRLAAG